MEYDLIVRGGTVVDGTGLPRRRIDIGIKRGKIARMGRLGNATAKEEIDATGRIVAPGVVDAHTHYDPQITFDPYATMSCFHGVTTVLAGNCGFSAAPCKTEDQEYLKNIFARVEDMDPIALNGVRWDKFETFDQFLDMLRGNLGINFACYVGHSNVRRWVMGDAAIERTATLQELDAMKDIVRRAMEAGAAGFSTSLLGTHLDTQDRPVPSRLADNEEILALAEAAGDAGSGSICFLPEGTIRGMSSVDHDFITEIAKRSGLPVIVQGLGGRGKTDVPGSGWEAALEALDKAQEDGTPFYSMLIARPFDRQVAFDETNHHWQACGLWHTMTLMPIEERRALLKDPEAREDMRFGIENPNTDADKGTTIPPPRWPVVFVDNSPSLPEEKHQGKSIAQLAEDAGVAPGDYALDLALADDFATKLRWRMNSPEWESSVEKTLSDPRMLIGTSDGGAHLAKDDQADWSSYFLGTWVRDRKISSLEEGVRQITQVPAALLGFADRGTLHVGGWADIMIFDADEIGPLRKDFVRDLPGGVGRYKAYGKGVYATIVNGQPIVLDGELTGRLPGMVVTPG
ncbi:MAG: amidohydrolase family protein [Sphingomonadaceae bacterium]|nr:amidohydrolase family protein [Sphingomonadaceae bacterium]